jgi:hypothetical protein
MSAAQWNERVHVAALALCAVFLPWSTAFLSMAQLLLVLNWIIGGVLTNTVSTRWRAAFTRPPVLVFLGFLGLHVVGLLWTTDMGWGMDLVRILLPVLSFGAVLGGSERLSQRSFRTILLLGAWSAVACALFGALFSNAREDDYRGLSMFISHIRLVLLLCMAIVVFVWKGLDGPWWDKLGRSLAVLWCLYFINRLGSVQGMVILAVVLLISVWRYIRPAQRPARVMLGLVLLVLPAFGCWWLVQQVEARTVPPPADMGFMPRRTVNGSAYRHEVHKVQQENGNHVWTYLSWDELRRNWPKRSDRSLDSLDARGHVMWATTVRYMASKGLTKDSVGVWALSDADVARIEQGVTNHLEGQRSALRERFEQVVFEWQHYLDEGASNGHSMTMRLEYWRTGWAIARANWLVGVGTGDTQVAFDEAYERMGSRLSREWRHRAHDQYLTLCISFGVFGLLFALFTWWWPARVSGAWRDPLFVAWAVIFGISCLTDDTVETQAGATFFALYYALLVFGAPRPVSADEGLRSAPSPARV